MDASLVDARARRSPLEPRSDRVGRPRDPGDPHGRSGDRGLA